MIFNNDKWNIVKDFRGKEIINLETKVVTEVKYLGDIENGYMLLSDYIQTDEYKAYLIEEVKRERRLEILIKISELDTKRIRAICEPSVKDEFTGETWLEFYTAQIIELRNNLEVI